MKFKVTGSTPAIALNAKNLGSYTKTIEVQADSEQAAIEAFREIGVHKVRLGLYVPAASFIAFRVEVINE